MGKRGRKAKDQFSGLSSTFRDAVLQSSTDEIKKRVSGIAILECTERAMLKVNPDVNQAKAALKNLMEPIRENLKSYKLQIEFCKRTLDDKDGGASSAKAEELAKAEKLAAASHATVDKLVKGILDPNGKGDTKVSQKPIGSTEYKQIAGPKS